MGDYLHRERDRPRRVPRRLWHYLLDLICGRCGVPLEHAALLASLHRSVPAARRVEDLRTINEVQALHWLWDYEQRYPQETAALDAARKELREKLTNQGDHHESEAQPRPGNGSKE